MIYWCFFIGYILITSVSVKSETVGCVQSKTTDGLKEVTCRSTSSQSSDKELMLPSDIPYDVEVLTIYEVLRLYITANTFSQFSNLKRITLKQNYFLDVGRPAEWFDNIYKNLFGGTILEEISLVQCALLNKDVFTYPRNVKMLNLSYNNYMNLDLKAYEDIETVNVSFNFLDAFPTFSFPPPPLRHLSVGVNPLKNISVNDVAELCWLKTLEISLSKSDLRNLNRKCECDRISQWAQEIQLKTVGLGCYRASNAERDSLNCSSYTLDEARKIREKCITADTGVSFVVRRLKKHAFKFLNLILASIILGFVAYIGYKLYNGTLTQASWKNRGNPVTNAPTEEGEEEYQDELEVNTE